MSHLLVTHTVTIGGFEYKMTRLNVVKSRQALAIVNKLLGGYEVGADGTVQNVLSPTFLAGITGKLTEQDTTKLVDIFAPHTTVDLLDGEGNRPSRVLTLNTPAAQDELWAGQLEYMLEWLDACIAFNFGGIIAKMHAAVADAEAKMRAAKAEAEARGELPSQE